MPATSLSAPSGLNSPYGGTLIDLRVDEARAAEMRATAKDYASLSLDEWGLCDLELLATGAFSPLEGFLNRADYERVVAQHGGTTLCSVISPYRGPRDNARKFSRGNFVEVYCDTPIEVCERRDVKGLYAKARAGQIKGFTGVDDPYEPPLNPEVTLDTNTLSVQECVHRIIDKLLELGYILPQGHI